MAFNGGSPISRGAFFIVVQRGGLIRVIRFCVHVGCRDAHTELRRLISIAGDLFDEIVLALTAAITIIKLILHLGDVASTNSALLVGLDLLKISSGKLLSAVF